MKKNRFLFLGILALALMFGLVLTGCPDLNGSNDDDKGPSVDTSVLETAIAVAENAKTGVLTTNDAAQVAAGLEWVTQGDMDTLNAAITDAKNALSSAATQVDVNAAVTTLNSAVTAFKGKIKTDGTKNSNFTPEELTQLIELAEGVKENVETSADGTDKAPSVYWVTQGTLTALNNAITAAKGAADANRDNLYKALINAINTFKAAKQPGKRANILTITGLSAYNGKEISLGLFDSQEVKGTPAISNNSWQVVQNGTVQVSLYTRGSGDSSAIPWAGTGSYYAAFMVEIDDNSGKLYVTNNKKSFDSHDITVPFSDFKETAVPTDNNNNDDNNRGEQIGKISGTITLTNIPNPKPEEIYISAHDSNWNWSSYSSKISLSGVSGNTASSIAWTIPLYENDSNGSLKDRTGTENISFRLYVQNAGSNNGFEIQLDSTKNLNLSDKSNIQAGDLGTVSIATITLSGTLKISNGGSPVPNVSISVYKKGGNNSSIGYGSLESPATSGESWSILIAAQEPGTEITFYVSAYDADWKNNIFSKEVSPDTTKSVSNQPVSGIVLDIGDISVGRMSGTVSFTNIPSPAPYSISLYASYGYSDTSSGKSIYGGRYTPVTLNGSTGTWSIPRDDDFLAALENGDQKVRFTLSITLNQGENGNSLAPIEKTVGKNGIGAVDLGSVAIPNYIKLSGTFTGTYNGGTVSRVNIYPRTQEGQSLGNGTYLSTPSTGTSWMMYIPALDTSTKLVFFVSGYSSDNTTLFSNVLVSPSQTQAVSNQPVSGIVINIGDIRPDTLSVANAPQGSYTAYITETYITQSNYASIISGNKKATGTGSGSSVTLTWDASVDKTQYKSYHVLISAGSVTKYRNYVSFVNGIGSIDWNDMTGVSGAGGGGDNGGNGSGTGGGGGGDDNTGGATLPGAKGKLTLTGFSEFNGKYVYSALVTTSGKALIGTNAVEITGGVTSISMVRINGGNAEVPLYYMNTSGTTVADLYVPYDGSETFSAVAVMIVNDSDGKFVASDAASFATNYAGMIGSNTSNTSFTPSTSNGSITISRSDAKTMTEMMADPTSMANVKYMLILPQ
jgi:hypothetical protein